MKYFYPSSDSNLQKKTRRHCCLFTFQKSSQFIFIKAVKIILFEMPKLYFLIFCIITWFCNNFNIVYSQENKSTYTLKEVVKEALLNNTTILRKKEAINESLYKKKQAKAGFLPSFETSYQYRRLGGVEKILTGSITGDVIETETASRDNFYWTTEISQPLFAGFAISSAYKSAKLEVAQRNAELTLEKLDLVLEVKKKYYDILIADKAQEIAKEEITYFEKLLESAQHYFESGYKTINDVLIAKIDLANSQRSFLKAQTKSRSVRAGMNYLLSKSVDSPVNISDALEYAPDSNTYKDAEAVALTIRPEIKLLNISYNNLNYQETIARSQSFPKVNLVYNYVKQGDTCDVSGSAFHDSESWNAYVDLSWKFWDWQKARNSILEIRSLKKQLIQQQKEVENKIRLEVKKAILTLAESEKNIPIAAEAIIQATENQRICRERYNERLATSVELVDAQKYLSRARIHYFNAIYDYKLAEASLIRAMGRIY